MYGKGIKKETQMKCKLFNTGLAGLLLAFSCYSNASIITTVSEILPPSNSVPGFTWYYSDMRAGGTASIADLTGLGGDLENNSPLGNDAVKLATTLANSDKAEIGMYGDFGLVSDIFNDSLSFSYDYYRENVVGGNTFAAPALKLGFLNDNCTDDLDCYFQLIYEPYLNAALVDSAWTTINIDLDLGAFWNTGGFGLVNGSGGCVPSGCLSLADTEIAANEYFSSASLVSIGLGVGSSNQGVTGYVDNVSVNVGNFSKTYDFEKVDVPEPSTLAIFALGMMGLASRRFKKQS